MFKILIRSNTRSDWTVYGEFASETEWKAEQAHIRFLRSMGPVYLRRVQG